jgi:hypothetical protein
MILDRYSGIRKALRDRQLAEANSEPAIRLI